RRNQRFRDTGGARYGGDGGRHFLAAGGRVRCGAPRLPGRSFVASSAERAASDVGLPRRRPFFWRPGPPRRRRPCRPPRRGRGALTAVPAAWRTRDIDFGQGPMQAVTIPWGDVSTAYRSTGIGDIEVYSAVSPRQARMMKLSRWFGWALRSSMVQRYLKRRI